MHTITDSRLASHPLGAELSFQKSLTSGLAGLVLLAILSRSSDDLYGYEIAQRLRNGSGHVDIKRSTLYPVLRALNARGLLSSRVVPSYAGPARRYYRITEDGRAMLRQWSDAWKQTRSFVERFVE